MDEAGVKGFEVVGFYSLAVGSVDPEDAPARAVKGLARHPVPVMILARLAVDRDHQGKGLGMALLKDALLRTAQAADRGRRVQAQMNGRRGGEGCTPGVDVLNPPPRDARDDRSVSGRTTPGRDPHLHYDDAMGLGSSRGRHVRAALRRRRTAANTRWAQRPACVRRG